MSFVEQNCYLQPCLKMSCACSHAELQVSKVKCPQKPQTHACNVFMASKLQFVLFFSNLIKMITVVRVTNYG